MSQTARYRQFVGEPMGDKPVTEVPGVGPVAADKLRTHNIIKAWDLYLVLQRLSFDLRRFQVWLKINCSGAKGELIHKALMDSHRQYYDGLNQGNGNVPRAPAQPGQGGGRARRGSTGGAARGAAVAARRASAARGARASNAGARRTSSAAAAAGSHQNGRRPSIEPPFAESNALQLFFASFADSCRNILPEFHTAMKRDILNVVDTYESRTRERQAEAAPGPAPGPAPQPQPRPSTSRAP